MNPPGGGSTYHATDGASYEVFLGRWTRRLAEPLLDFADFPATGRLLDVGCGTGSMVCAMGARWPARSVIGTDIAWPYIAFAHSRTRLANLHFEVADAARLPHPNASFSGAATQLVLNFVPDPAAVLREIQRVSIPGCPVVAAVWDFRGGLVYQRIFWDTAAGIDPAAAATRDKLFSGPLALPEGLLQLFESARFNRAQRTSIAIRMDYANFNDYWQPLCSGQGPVGTYLVGLAPDLRAHIEEAVASAYRSGAPDGPRSLTAAAWAVRGEVR